MVGNSEWGFPGRDVYDLSRKTTKVFLWIPHKTDKGWRWLRPATRVSTIEINSTSGILSFLGFEAKEYKEVIKYEA